MTSTDEALKFETKSFISVHQRMKAQRLNNVYPEFLIEGTLKSHYSVVKPKIYNLNAKEIDSIQKLAISPEFIVTPADKNLGITLWGTDHYQQELARQLNAATHYKELTDEQSCRQLIKDIYLKYLPLLQVGSKKIYDILNHKHTKTVILRNETPQILSYTKDTQESSSRQTYCRRCILPQHYCIKNPEQLFTSCNEITLQRK